MSTAIEFNNISKQYRLGLVSSGTIRDDLKRWWTMSVRHKEDPFLKIGETNDRSSKGMSDYVWALKDIDFKVEQGDVVGIIGKNGAGKSTLLKILSKITAPTTGTIKAKGRIGSLLEVGTGFHPEMTGRENIYLNGAILGMSKQEIDRKLDEIVDFSGCERYIDTPVKRYSSGMMVRLGFAVAAHLDPEILVVDEVLAVGDAEFQKKAIGKMQDVSKGDGRTVLFVSHNMNSIKLLCKHGILLERGSVKMTGFADEVVDYYLAEHMNQREYVNPKPFFVDPLQYALIESIRCVDGRFEFSTVDDIAFDLTLLACKNIEECRINCTIYTLDDVPVGTVISAQTFNIQEREKKVVRLILTNHNLTLGDYKVAFSVGTGRYNEVIVDYHVVMDALVFKVIGYSHNKGDGYMQWHKQWGSNYFPHKLMIIG